MKRILPQIAAGALLLGLSLVVGTVGTVPPALAQTFSTPLNLAVSTLAADHAPGSGTLQVQPGDGPLFGTPSPSAPVRVTVAKRSTMVPPTAAGRMTPTTVRTVYLVTARTADTLSGLTVAEGTSDQAYTRNDPVQALFTAGMLSELQSAILTLPVDASVVHKTGIETIADAKTFTSPIVGTITGAIAEGQVTGLASDLAAREAIANKGVAGGYAGLDSGGKVPTAQLPPAQVALGGAVSGGATAGYLLSVGAGPAVAQQPVATDAQAQATAIYSVAAWGDSTVWGTGSTTPGGATSWPARLSALAYRDVYNGGVPGETSTQVRARMHGDPTKYDDPSIFEVGRNNITLQADILADVAAMVADLASVGNSSYLVMAVLPDASETQTPLVPGRTTLNNVNAALAAAYGTRYIDVLPSLQAASDGSAGDITDVAAGVTPRSKRASGDTYHLSDSGNVVVATRLSTSMASLNGVDPIVRSSNVPAILRSSLGMSVGAPMGGSPTAGGLLYPDASGKLAYDPSNLSWLGGVLTVRGDLATNAYQVRTLSRAATTVVGDWTYFALLNNPSTNGASIYEVHLVVSGTLSQSKLYRLAVGFTDTGAAWQSLVPVDTSGPSGADDFGVDVIGSGNSVQFRVRRLAGTTAGATLTLVFRQTSGAVATFGPASLTGNDVTTLPVFSSGQNYTNDPTHFGWDRTTRVLTALGDLVTDSAQWRTLRRSTTTTVGDWTYLALFDATPTTGATTYEVTLAVYGAAIQSKCYRIAVAFGTSGAWKTVVPIASTGPSGTDDWDLEIINNGFSTQFRVRRRAGATAGSTIAVVFRQTSGATATYSPASLTGNDVSTLALYGTTGTTAFPGTVSVPGGLVLPQQADASIPSGGIAWSTDTPNTLKVRTPAGVLNTVTIAP